MAADAAQDATPGMWTRLVAFYHGVMAEMKKVTWPDRPQVRSATIAILIFVLAAIINAALGALQGLQRSHGRKKAADLAAAKSALAATSGA